MQNRVANMQILYKRYGLMTAICTVKHKLALQMPFCINFLTIQELMPSIHSAMLVFFGHFCHSNGRDQHLQQHRTADSQKCDQIQKCKEQLVDTWCCSILEDGLRIHQHFCHMITEHFHFCWKESRFSFTQLASAVEKPS